MGVEDICIEILTHLGEHEADATQVQVLQIIGACNGFENLLEEGSNLCKSIASEVSQRQEFMIVITSAIKELNNSAELVVSPMLLTLWNFLYYKWPKSIVFVMS